MKKINNDKILITHTTLNSKGICHIGRVNDYVCKKFGFFLVDGKRLDEYEFIGELDQIIFSYDGISFQQRNFIELLEKFPKAKVYYITTEYLLDPHSLKTQYFRNNNRCRVICNFEKFKRSFVEREHNMVNWKVLMHRGYNELVRFDRDNLIYWGRYRKDRSVYFKRYLNFRGVYISTMPKNIGLFQLDCVNATYCRTLLSDYNWGYFNYSVYIEDVGTHENYNFMASRFYEAIDRGIVMFIDVNCKNSVDKSYFSSFDFSGLYVDGYEDVQDRIRNIDRDYVKSLYKDMYGIIEEEKKELYRQLVEIFDRD